MEQGRFPLADRLTTVIAAKAAMRAAMALMAALAPITALTATPVGLDKDEAGYWMLSERAERDLRTSAKLLDRPLLADAIDELACRTVGRLCERLRIYLIRRPGANATMLPNGAMTIQTGLLIRLANDAELAAVIGHEAAHFTRRHSLVRLRRWERTSSGFAMASVLVAAAGQVAAASANTYEGMAEAQNLSNTAMGMVNLASAIAVFQLLAYDRGQEREADVDGLEMLTANGMDPHAPASLWARIDEEHKAGGNMAGFSLLHTHPTPKARMTYLSELAASAPKTEPATATAPKAVIRQIAQDRGSWLQDELAVQPPEQFTVLLDHQMVHGLRPGWRGHLEAKSWLREAKRVKGRERKAALRQALSAFETGDAAEDSMPADAYRDWGKVELEVGKAERAIPHLRRYLAEAPDAWDAKYVKRLIKANES